jgi:hypothetical protein
MLVVRGQRQDDMVDARASAACTTAAARGGAYWPWRGPTGIGWRFPRLCESHEFAVFRQAASIMVIDTVGRGEACNIHHLKGFGISKGSEFALSTTAAKSTPGGIQAEILSVLRVLAPRSSQ